MFFKKVSSCLNLVQSLIKCFRRQKFGQSENKTTRSFPAYTLVCFLLLTKETSRKVGPLNFQMNLKEFYKINWAFVSDQLSNLGKAFGWKFVVLKLKQSCQRTVNLCWVNAKYIYIQRLHQPTLRHLEPFRICCQESNCLSNVSVCVSKEPHSNYNSTLRFSRA